MPDQFPETEIASLIHAELYPDRESVIKEALQALLTLKPSLRVEIGIDRYLQGEVSLWKAAEGAGYPLEAFKQLLHSRGHSIQIISDQEASERRLAKVFGD